MLYQVLESPPPLAEKLRLSHIVLMCPHHLEVKSPPNVHSHSHKRPLQVSTTGPKFTGKNHQSATKVTLTSHQQGSLPSLPSHSPHSQSTKCTYGPMDIEVYILMSPLHVRASFSGPTSCDRLRLAPLTPISLPSLPACLPHSCLLPSCSSSLPMANEQLSMFQGPHHLWGARGQGVSWEQAGARGLSYNQQVFVGVPITSALKFWSATTSVVTRLPPLTPKSLPSLPKH